MQRDQARQTMTALREAVRKIDRRHAGPVPGPWVAGARDDGSAGFAIPAVDSVFDTAFPVFDLHEIRCPLTRDIAAATGFLAGMLAACMKDAHGRIAWIDEPAGRMESGQLFPSGLALFGIDPTRLLVVHPADLKTALWAGDEAAGCHDLAAMVFHVRGNPAAFDMTATRRLMLKARQNRVFACILRQGGEEEANAAATRWCVRALPSLVDPQLERGIGLLRLDLALERNRNGRTGQWAIAWNHRSRNFEHLTAHPFDRTALPPDRPHGAARMGQVVALDRAS
jgi:protein ImuA